MTALQCPEPSASQHQCSTLTNAYPAVSTYSQLCMLIWVSVFQAYTTVAKLPLLSAQETASAKTNKLSECIWLSTCVTEQDMHVCIFMFRFVFTNVIMCMSTSFYWHFNKSGSFPNLHMQKTRLTQPRNHPIFFVFSSKFPQFSSSRSFFPLLFWPKLLTE